MKRYGLREQAVENRVSQVLGAMSVTWIVTRDCEWVEKSLIGLLRTVVDIKLPTAPSRSPFSTASRAWHVAR